jgi:SAM-dependent methyltransferase
VTGSGFDPRVITAAYAPVADDYAAKFGDDLAGLPLDRSLLDVVAERCRDRGLVLDLGCGPAQLAEYLTARGVDCAGIDLTPAMLAAARRRVPNLRVAVGDLRSLAVRTGGVAGIVVFYVLQHVDRSELRAVMQELRRALATGGVLLIAAHAGDGAFMPAPEIRATRYTATEFEQECSNASFVVDAVRHRPPLRHEHQGDRVYVLAKAL